MKDNDKLIISNDPEEVTGCIPDDIKVHSVEKVKTVPDSIKHLSDDVSGCRIVPDTFSESSNDIGFNGTVSNRGEKIRIVPSGKKINGKLFT